MCLRLLRRADHLRSSVSCLAGGRSGIGEAIAILLLLMPSTIKLCSPTRACTSAIRASASHFISLQFHVIERHLLLPSARKWHPFLFNWNRMERKRHYFYASYCMCYISKLCYRVIQHSQQDYNTATYISCTEILSK